MKPLCPILALDPGFTKLGVAVYLPIDGRYVLFEAITVYGQSRADAVEKVRGLTPPRAILVREVMEKRDKFGVAHDDLERVEETSKMIEDAFDEVRRIRPHAWKGNVPKTVCRRRLLALLTEEERASFHDHGHDAYDAAGIGLVATGRAKRGLLPLEKQ